jgi:hypothetical protein
VKKVIMVLGKQYFPFIVKASRETEKV